MTFLPAPVLQGVDLDHMDVDEFLGYLAKARYLEEIQQNIQTNAIISAFGDEESN